MTLKRPKKKSGGGAKKKKKNVNMGNVIPVKREDHDEESDVDEDEVRSAAYGALKY